MPEFIPSDWVAEIVARVESGELSLERALHAAALVPLGTHHDVTEHWQCILIALGYEELATHFAHVVVVHGEAGAGISVKGDGHRPLGLDDLTADEHRAVSTASMAVLRRIGIPASVGIEGNLIIEGDEEEEDPEKIVQRFISQLDNLDQPRTGWDKWTRGGET